MRHFLIAIVCLACDAAGASTHAVKPRELVHAYPPTGPAEIAGTALSSKVLRTMQRYAVPAFTDVLAMHVAQTLQGASDEPVMVKRRPRQGGRDAAVVVSSAAADGRTLLLASSIPAGSKATSRSNWPADIALRPVALVASMPYVLIANSESRHASLGDLIREARGAPERQLIGSAGEKSAGHLALGLLRLHHGLAVEPVAYNGGHAALQAVATKQVSTALVPLPAALPYLGGGRIKALAIAESRRHPGIPQLQTTAEAGVADFEAIGWFGVFVAAGTPQSVIRGLNTMLARSPESEQTRQVFSDFGLRLEHRAADAFAELLEREQQRGSGFRPSVTNARTRCVCAHESDFRVVNIDSDAHT